MAVAVAISISATTLVILVVLIVGLARQVGRLSLSIAEMNQAIRPVLESIRDETERASTRLERLTEGKTKSQEDG
ncbi:MAG: hypothetical protein ACRDH6_09060 [Actinomycetota bacterium]